MGGASLRVPRGVGGVITLFLAACGTAEDLPQPPQTRHIVDVPEVVISTESAIVGIVNDVLVLEDGTVYLSDGQAHAVHVVEPGGAVRSIGREGSGPGELLRPNRMQRLGDTLAVVDDGNGRLQLLTLAGDPLSSRPLPPGAPPTVSATGGFVQSVFGADSALALMYSGSLEVVAKLGAGVGSPPQVVRIGAMKDQIAAGEIPGIFLNSAEAAAGADGTIWLFVPATGSVSRYGQSGSESWTIVLDEPEFASVRADFVQRNAQMARNRIWPLRYVLDARPVDSDLWILLGQSLFDPASILVLSSDGEVKERLTLQHVSGVSRFGVDVERGLLYFTLRESAELLRVRYSPPA